jgi:hypothetical protein
LSSPNRPNDLTFGPTARSIPAWGIAPGTDAG